MQKTKQHNNGGHPLIKALKSICVLLVLVVYLIIPFKQQFLDTIHMAGHIAMYESPHHTHDHAHENANHHHGYLEFLSQATNAQGNTTPIPVELVNYQFQTPLLTEGYLISEYLPSIIKKTIHTLFVPILTGPSFDVPTPPP